MISKKVIIRKLALHWELQPFISHVTLTYFSQIELSVLNTLVDTFLGARCSSPETPIIHSEDPDQCQSSIGTTD